MRNRPIILIILLALLGIGLYNALSVFGMLARPGWFHWLIGFVLVAVIGYAVLLFTRGA